MHCILTLLLNLFEYVFLLGFFYQESNGEQIIIDLDTGFALYGWQTINWTNDGIAHLT